MFKNEELKYIDLNYFHIIKIMQDENFIEIQSMSTKDFWIIKKNKFFKEKFPIILYHKHPKQKYYHRHWQCYKVSQCIESIKNHDCYAKNKRHMKFVTSKL